MSRYVAFLRAINVGRGRTVKMGTLRHLFDSLGFSNVATFIASGNVLFETRTRNRKSLERKIERRLREALGYEVETFLRTDTELARIASYSPFPKSTSRAATEVNIIFLADRIGQKLARKVRALRAGTDEFHPHGREIYWLRRRKRSGSPFSTVPLDKALGKPFTIRSAKTVKKITLKLSAKR